MTLTIEQLLNASMPIVSNCVNLDKSTVVIPLALEKSEDGISCSFTHFEKSTLFNVAYAKTLYSNVSKSAGSERSVNVAPAKASLSID